MKKILIRFLLLFIVVGCSEPEPSVELSPIEVEVGTELTINHIDLDESEADFTGYDPYLLGRQEVKVNNQHDLLVTVVDTTPPVLLNKSEAPITLNQNESIDFSLYITANDNSKKRPTITTSDFDTTKTGEFLITITATDSSGNSSEIERMIVVNESIDFTLKQNKLFDVTLNSTLNLNNYFTSNIPKAELVITGDFDLNTKGSYPVQVIATYQDNTRLIETILHVVEPNEETITGGYTIIEPAPIRDDRYTIVNKRYQLDGFYVPERLVSVPDEHRILDQQITRETLEAYLELRQAGLDAGVDPMFRSGYRSYELQDSVYQGYLRRYPKEEVDTFSARAGHSEHQLGTVIDFCEGETICFDNFTGSQTQQWMIDNAHHYGFILRFPQGEEEITGYNYESWHYRYVGKSVAEHFVTTGLTYDEYYFQFPELLK